MSRVGCVHARTNRAQQQRSVLECSVCTHLVLSRSSLPWVVSVKSRYEHATLITHGGAANSPTHPSPSLHDSETHRGARRGEPACAQGACTLPFAAVR